MTSSRRPIGTMRRPGRNVSLVGPLTIPHVPIVGSPRTVLEPALWGRCVQDSSEFVILTAVDQTGPFADLR